ncbi:hypothetical protein M8818_005675 [Zalaria obscura]|uniref:Uncharacterized protein n=1 Tax=Zalaria obscura TaxID=2024903 RepID=A0ACC3S8N4_9PEZI
MERIEPGRELAPSDRVNFQQRAAMHARDTLTAHWPHPRRRGHWEKPVRRQAQQLLCTELASMSLATRLFTRSCASTQTPHIGRYMPGQPGSARPPCLSAPACHRSPKRRGAAKMPQGSAIRWQRIAH